MDAILIKHSKTLRRNQQRKFRRRPLSRNCIYYPIEVITTGRRRSQKKRAYVQKQFRHIGVLNDISAGGCSISSQTPLGRGRLLMIEFELGDRRPLTAYGKVRRLNLNPKQSGVMHIIFTKVSSANLNRIYSYVYSYIRPPSQRVIPRPGGGLAGRQTSETYAADGRSAVRRPTIRRPTARGMRNRQFAVRRPTYYGRDT